MGLFPTPEDQTYWALVSVWVQLRALALTDPELDERIRALTPMLRRSTRDAAGDLEADGLFGTWVTLEGLRHELVRPGSALTPPAALAVLQQTVSRDRLEGIGG